MPLYEYICRDCKQVFEMKQSLSEKEEGSEQTCSACGSINTAQYFGNMIVIASTHLH